MGDTDSSGDTASNFSPAAVRRAIRNEALTHPLTLYPVVLGALGGLAGFLFASPWLLLAGLGGALTGVGALTVNFFFRDNVFGERYLARLREDLARRQERELQSVADELAECREIPEAGPYADHASTQYVAGRQKYEDLKKLLDEKFGSGELDLGGVWGAAEEVCLGILDNLREITGVLRSVAGIDPVSTRERLRQLAGLKRMTQAEQREAETLKKRLQIRKQQFEKVEELLACNEEALTTMAETAVAVADIDSGEGFTEVDQESSAERLKQLAKSISQRHGKQPT